MYTINSDATFWSLANNLMNPAQRIATKKAAHHSKQDGTAYRIEWQTSKGEWLFWEGARHDVVFWGRNIVSSSPLHQVGETVRCFNSKGEYFDATETCY